MSRVTLEREELDARGPRQKASSGTPAKYVGCGKFCGVPMTQEPEEAAGRTTTNFRQLFSNNSNYQQLPM